MTRNYREQVYELMATASGMNHTPEAVALAEDAVRLADTHNDVALAYEARQGLMDVTSYSGDYDKLLLAFSWCLAQSDKEPEKYSEWELLWKYKWVIEHLVHFPRITRVQIVSALEDFRKRCDKAGFNERAALFLRWVVEMQMGDPVEAGKWHAKWKLTKRDGMADCEACEINRVAELYAMQGKHEAAIRAAGPILKGRMKCGEIPHLTCATLLQSFWQVRGPAEAVQIHEKGYRLVRGNRDFIREQAWHILHLLRAGQSDQAMTLIRRHFSWALETRNPDYQLFFLLSTRAVMRQLSEAGSKSVRLRVSEKSFPLAGKTSVAIQPFTEWLTEKINALVSEFDHRNGNNWFAQLAEKTGI
jgi:hypothetical protein